MAENKILPWAQTGTANVLSDADYASDVASGGLYGDGVKTGQASSKQANKTWRQATAPGSGLGQFLVDNLSVDVTDADTPATFSTRIANAVLKLAQISPFNQSWATATGGYRKYAIVSDSSGNYWVSTADANTTVPGAVGAKWKSLFDGYATQAWSSSQFVGRGASVYDFTPLQLGVNKTSGQVWTSYTDASGNVKYAFSQPAGDYATNTALNTEITNRTNADASLQSSKANLIGGNQFSGDQTVKGNIICGLGSGWAGGTTSGAQRWSNAHLAFGAPDGVTTTYTGYFQITDTYGDSSTNTSGVNMFGFNYSGARYDWFFSWNGNIQTPKGLVAFESDISNLQNQINGKQPAGSYVTASQYSDDFSTSDSRVINLAWGHRLQGFIVAVSGSGVHNISFPVAFSSPPETIVISHGLTNGNNASVSVLGGWTATGFQIKTNGDTSVNFLAMGAK